MRMACPRSYDLLFLPLYNNGKENISLLEASQRFPSTFGYIMDKIS